MLPVTPRFLASLRESHQVSVAANVYTPTAPTTPIAVDIISGQVTIDANARVRRHASLEIAFSLQDATARDLVRSLPFGGTATIERGIRYPDGSVERVQLGRLRVDSIVWRELQGSAMLTLSDRMAQIQDEAFTVPFQPTGMHPSDAVVQAVRDVFGTTIQYHVLTSPATEPVIGSMTVYLDDRAAALTDLASSVNAETLFDNQGDFVIRPTGSSGAPAWIIDAGDRGAMLSAEETLDRSSVRNGVVVRGQADAETEPFYALATYDDPNAPTRWGGPFGRVAMISESTTITSQAQANAAARSLLNLRLGLQRTLTLQSLPNPALEPGDIIQLVFADGRTEQQTVNSTNIQLDPSGALLLTTSSHLLGLPTLRPGRRIRLYRGGAALDELARATLIAA
jgi:Domain of unknown function (DUF5047)